MALFLLHHPKTLLQQSVKTSEFDYELPSELIAQTPREPRDASRLLLLGRERGEITHGKISALPGLLRSGDMLVFNDTRVLLARLFGKKPTGGKVELLLLNRRAPHVWEALVGGRGVRVGMQLSQFGDSNDLTATVLEELDGPRRIVEFSLPIRPVLSQIGHIPLPPYIHSALDDPERYQTVYAREDGSAAAPTAGLHFTEDLLGQLQAAGVETTFVTLQVGLDTFAPMTVENVAEHEIHSEWCRLDPEVATRLRQTKENGGRIIAVGTTTVRVLESAAQAHAGKLAAFEGKTKLFITPGFTFQVVDALLTNFHLPRSTLLLLVSAFAEPDGIQKIRAAYAEAKANGYRFYSFGDAMLIA